MQRTGVFSEVTVKAKALSSSLLMPVPERLPAIFLASASADLPSLGATAAATTARPSGETRRMPASWGSSFHEAGTSRLKRWSSGP